MMRNNYRISNQKTAYILTVIIVFINIITIVIPLFFIYTFPTSKIAILFFSYPSNLLIIFGVVFLIYFIITGVHYFDFKADKYIIEIKSNRTISSYFFEIPLGSINRFTFLKRPYTFNSTLMIKVKVSSRKSVAKRFQISFFNKEQRAKITESLEEIVQNNNLDG
jgi:hypothetical protein